MKCNAKSIPPRGLPSGVPKQDKLYLHGKEMGKLEGIDAISNLQAVSGYGLERKKQSRSCRPPMSSHDREGLRRKQKPFQFVF